MAEKSSVHLHQLLHAMQFIDSMSSSGDLKWQWFIGVEITIFWSLLTTQLLKKNIWGERCHFNCTTYIQIVFNVTANLYHSVVIWKFLMLLKFACLPAGPTLVQVSQLWNCENVQESICSWALLARFISLYVQHRSVNKDFSNDVFRMLIQLIELLTCHQQ